MKCYIAVDLGSSNGKILTSYIKAGPMITEEVKRFAIPRVFVNGHICINVYGIYSIICQTLSELAAQGMEIVSIGVDSWSSDFGLINASNELVGLPVFYRDKRTNGMVAEVEKTISYRELYSLTTQRRIQDATLCQLLAVKKEQPLLLDKNNKMMHIGDLIMWMFSGKICSEFSVASYSQMFSMKKKTWEDSVFHMFGIPIEMQPDIVFAGDCLGTISQKMADAWRTNRFEVITPAVHDTSSVGVAVPAVKDKKWAYISTGSWYLVSRELEKPADQEKSYQHNLSNTGLAFGKTLLKRNVCAMWIIQECRRMWNNRNIACDYSEIVQKAQSAKPFYAMIDPDAPDFYNPENMLEAIVGYLEKTEQPLVKVDDVGQIARIVYEGISFKCRYSLEALIDASEEAVETIFVLGGTSSVPFLNQLLASALERSVIACSGEAAAIGNSLMQAYGCEELSSEDEVRRIAADTFVQTKYDPEESGMWGAKYKEYLGLRLV